MHVLEYENYTVKPTEECFLIKPLRDLYTADKSKHKDNFMLALSVVYFMADPRSSYNYIVDEKERLKAIIEQEGLPKKFKLTKEIQSAIDEYRKHTVTTSSLLLEDTRIAVEKVRLFLRNVDLNQTDDKGKPIYTINTITTAIKQIPELTKNLMEAEKALSKELEETGRARGGNEKKSLMDDNMF